MIEQSRKTWMTIFAISVIVLILRVIDFAGEASDLSFHMTRVGIHVMGVNAFFIQLLIILISALFMRKALGKLVKISTSN